MYRYTLFMIPYTFSMGAIPVGYVHETTAQCKRSIGVSYITSRTPTPDGIGVWIMMNGLYARVGPYFMAHGSIQRARVPIENQGGAKAYLVTALAV